LLKGSKARAHVHAAVSGRLKIPYSLQPLQPGVAMSIIAETSATSSCLRRAPEGFSATQWRIFRERGILVIENALRDDEIKRYLEAVRCLQNREATQEDNFFTTQNFIEKDPAFSDLIDDPRHVGMVYDLYSEMLKLQLSELFVRPPGAARPEHWHIDGPRVLPYSAFRPKAPLQVKIGYWLTDIPEPGMGNLVYVPGSHRQQYFDAYNTHEEIAGEEFLCVYRGALTVMDCALWHRTSRNDSATTRINLYLGYCPSWIPSADRNVSNPTWLASLNREQRIIMRSYEKAYSHAKPPPEDFPLFLDRESGADREPHKYRELVRLFHRKRTAWWEMTDG
jgi:ectoine hydroxylase-related dioxygenase (phytanoyl-CoA dioxygenase family)